jgi:hypothetical protein
MRKDMNTNWQGMRLWTPAIIPALTLSLSLALPVQGGKRAQTKAAGSEEFFVISSVDLRKNQIVLKRPTEVTELVLVTQNTVYSDEDGKALRFQDLRAGDTVYVTLVERPDGVTATRIRKGPMTVEELQRRYLKQ